MGDSASRTRAPARRKVARHEIRSVLRQRIFDGECRPGSKLIQQQLAKDFGVSMGVIREALLELQAWGLVETHDNRGIFVREWNLDRVVESYDVREMLEGLAARLCCGRLSSESFATLDAMVEEIYHLAQQEQSDRNAKLDRELHHRIVELSGNRTLLRLTDTYRFASKMVWVGPKTDARETREGHRRIIQAIRENHPAEAELAARAHVARGRQFVQELDASGEFDPHWLI
jgi:DNA-binding GntR family transcriptional regulator